MIRILFFVASAVLSSAILGLLFVLKRLDWSVVVPSFCILACRPMFLSLFTFTLLVWQSVNSKVKEEKVFIFEV